MGLSIFSYQRNWQCFGWQEECSDSHKICLPNNYGTVEAICLTGKHLSQQGILKTDFNSIKITEIEEEYKWILKMKHKLGINIGKVKIDRTLNKMALS